MSAFGGHQATPQPSSTGAGAGGAPALPDLERASLDDVRAIILGLYAPGTRPELRKALDRWLEAYQRRPEAWGMADQFLTADAVAAAAGAAGAPAPPNAPTPEQQQQLTLFAAITMHHKVRYDFLDLPPASHPSLRDTLLRHIARLAEGGGKAAGGGGGSGGAGGAAPVLSRLCLAFSSLVVQTPGLSGEDAVASVTRLFAPPTGTLPLLEILTTLAEEASNTRTPISGPRRSEFLAGLRASAPGVLALLQQVLSAGAQSSATGWVERVFRCFTAWVGACDLPAALVASCPLFTNAFEALLRYPALFHAACDCIQELLAVYQECVGSGRCGAGYWKGGGGGVVGRGRHAIHSLLTPTTLLRIYSQPDQPTRPQPRARRRAHCAAPAQPAVTGDAV